MIDTWIQLGVNAKKQGNFDAAITYFKKARYSKNKEVRFESGRLLADVYYLKGEIKKASYICNRLLRNSLPVKVRAPLTHLKAILLEDKGNLKKAEGFYRRALKLFENINRDFFEMTRVHLGLNLFFQGERERGIQFLTQGIYEKRKGNRLAKFIAYLNLAHIRALQGRHLEARCLLQRGRNYTPEAPFYQAWLFNADAFLKEQEGKKEETIAILEELYNKYKTTKLPFLNEITFSLARFYLEQGDITKAKKIVYQTKKLFEKTKEYYSQTQMYEIEGLINFYQRRYNRSLESFKKVRMRYAKAPYPFEETKALFYECLILFHLNRQAQCLRLLKETMKRLFSLRYWALFNDANFLPLFKIAYEKGFLEKKESEPDFCCQLFGPFLLKIGDRSITAQDFKNKQALKVFHILLLNPDKPISVETFYEFVWPKKSLRVAKKGLYEAVSYCRRLCVPFGEFIKKRRDAYIFTAPEKIFIDTMEIEKKFQYGQFLENDGKNEDALSSYSVAISFYQGEPVAEFLYERFAEEYRAYFKNFVMKIFNRAVVLALKLRKERLAQELLERAFSIDETDENIAKIYVDLCFSKAEKKKAVEIYRTHRTKMWRRFRLKPSFNISSSL